MIKDGEDDARQKVMRFRSRDIANTFARALLAYPITDRISKRLTRLLSVGSGVEDENDIHPAFGSNNQSREIATCVGR